MKKLNKIISGAVCAAAASAGLTISARAVDTTLTLSQTLALYGSKLDVLYSSSSTGVQTPYTLDFVGTSLDYVPDFSPDGTNLIIDGSYGYGTSGIGAGDTALLNYAPYIRYGAYLPIVDQQPAVGHIQGTYSVDLSPITSFSSCYLVTKGTGRNWGTDNQEYNATASQNQSAIFFDTSYNASVRRNSSTNSSSRQRVILTPFVKRSIGSDKYLEDDFVMSMWLDYANSSLTNDGETFSLNGWSIDWVRPAGRNWDDVLNTSRGWVEIWIQCPTIGDYTPPVTTTTPQTTTRPQTYTTRPHDYTQYASTPANTIDLSQIEENQRIQIEIENDNRNYNAGTFDGINIIINQLNDIYAQMQARGEIAVDLLDGVHPDFLSSDMRADIRNALSSHTTARLPDVQSGKTFFGALFDWITQFRYVAAFAFFSLAAGFAAYVIFRG